MRRPQEKSTRSGCIVWWRAYSRRTSRSGSTRRRFVTLSCCCRCSMLDTGASAGSALGMRFVQRDGRCRSLCTVDFASVAVCCVSGQRHFEPICLIRPGTRSCGPSWARRCSVDRSCVVDDCVIPSDKQLKAAHLFVKCCQMLPSFKSGRVVHVRICSAITRCTSLNRKSVSSIPAPASQLGNAFRNVCDR